MGIVIVIGQGNFHIKENGQKFTNSWELMNLSKSAEFHFYKCADFIRGLTFWTHTYSENWQNFRSYDILHDHVGSL